jgi:hypothetical protein
MAGLRPGPYALLVAAQGYVPRDIGDWNEKERVEIRADGVAEVEVVLPRTAALLVAVSDEETLDPIDGVRFEAVLAAEHWSMLVPLPATRLDDAYEVHAALGERGFESTEIRVSRDGYSPRYLSFYGQEAGCRFDVALGRGGAIVGHVRTSGEPVRGALVLVERVDSRRVIASATTGRDGAFEIGPLAAGEELAVHAYDLALDPIAVVDLTLENGEERVLEIGGPATAIEGRVSVAGEPEVAATVRVSGAGYSDSGATGRNGRYCIEGLRAGRCEVEVFASAYFRRFVQLADGQRLRLDIDARAVIAGVVVDAETGAPLADAAEMQLDVSALPVASTGSTSVRVDSDGGFRLPVEPGVYELDVPDSEEVYAIARPRVDLTQAAGIGPVTLRVRRDPRDGKIALSIKDAVTGEAVPEGDYEYQFKCTHGWGSFDDGVLAEVSLSLGTHRFRIHSVDHAPTKVELTLTPDRTIVNDTVALRPAEAVRIAEIRRGSAGWVAGLRAGDVIRAVSGNAAPSIAALHAALAVARGPVTIEFERGGERRTASLPASELGAELENILLGR